MLIQFFVVLFNKMLLSMQAADEFFLNFGYDIFDLYSTVFYMRKNATQACNNEGIYQILLTTVK
jgi:hypothetical protein